MRFNLACTLALFVALALASAPPAHAGGVVSTCNETSLRTALAGGGAVTFACSGTIILKATITISSDTTIDGTGQTVAISGGGAVQVLFVPSGVTLNLIKLTIALGNAVTGGGMDDRGTVTLTNCTFTYNTASGDGGAIEVNTNAPLTITNSTFSNNISGTDGGAINNNFDAPITVTGSTFVGNLVTGGYGGGINNDYAGAVTVINSTFTGNSPSAISNARGTVTVTNSTISGNSSGISGNPPVILKNTIMANNTGGNCGGPITDGGGNLSWPDTTCAGINVDPKLDPSGLQNNGGPTQTIALLAGSPAIDAAVVANCPPTDQRGVPRFNDGHCDIGAYEPPPDFWLTAQPVFWGYPLRKLIGFRVTVTAIKGFNGTVALSCSDPGCSLNPTSIVGSGTSLVTGPNLVGAVTGTSGSLVHAAALTLPPPPPQPCHPRTCQ